MIYAPSQVSCPSKVSVPPSDYHDREFGTSIYEIFLKNVAFDDWHDPLFSLQNLVKVPHQEVIEHRLVIPRFESFHVIWV